ncbi:VOC family protein [Roseisolibacter sp. H3M3-2]|uniref:bleomycin resistance protein n=1 Tax=Roseisolibacter sp. H3M3-2 TaxID=3031323 RepID=UPI0023DBFBAC|nr:VOC family protein [Roseisolibacter sp. H3M3-2]MDF1504820.1 VOC family protein [Roseisolibacter sp. H3M3-2]
MREHATPILPARDIREARDFYQRLGFTAGYFDPDASNGYVILRRGDVDVHFFAHREVEPTTSHAGCYWYVADADAWHREFSALGLPDRGIPRLTAPEDRPWGMREFALVDPNGNLVRVGHPLPAP